MTEIATIDWFGRWGCLFSLKTLLYLHITSMRLTHILVISLQFAYHLSMRFTHTTADQ